jgi:hypothetical protein
MAFAPMDYFLDFAPNPYDGSDSWPESLSSVDYWPDIFYTFSDSSDWLE